MKITLLGASGFVGRHLSAALRARGDALTSASLRDPAAAARACAGADVVVNLAGEPVAQRWSPAVKEKIRASRVDAPRALLGALAGLGGLPKAYVSASAVGYYGTSERATFDEASGPGDDFLAGVCVAWEAEADRASALGMRVAKIRTGLVLGTDGGALAKLLPIFKVGGGGPVASGRQWYSWIHIDDQVGIYLHAIDGAAGVLDATAPVPVTNAEFTRALAAALHRPAIVPIPAFALSLALGEGAAVVTKGQRVLPTRTLASGYAFRYATIEGAFAALLTR
ncbi:MAG: TIGR01777 family oxidoreductase [Vulcanimicrobiaceae bacterium]